MKKPPNTFCGLDKLHSDYNNAKAAIIPIPYEMTTTYVKGTKDGPSAIIDASKYLELYDEELDSVTSDIGISTLKPFRPRHKPEVMVDKIKEHCLNVINDNKFPVMLGGEHSVSVGFLKALIQKKRNLSVLQLDAHADLRDELNGSRYNHGCVMARMRECCDSVVQVGIRSISHEEAVKAKKNDYKIYWAKDKANPEFLLKNVLDNLKQDVYITVDVDVFNPSLVPAVGTPEPGGLDWYDVLDITREIFKQRNVIGFDVVELCPDPEDKSSDFIIAKLIYKMLGYKFFSAAH